MTDDDPHIDLSIRPRVGLTTSETIQFVEGDWRDVAARGVYISEAAFDLIEPVICRALPPASFIDRYGVTSLSSPVVARAVDELRTAASCRANPADEQRRLFEGLAAYLEDVETRGLPVTVLGY